MPKKPIDLKKNIGLYTSKQFYLILFSVFTIFTLILGVMIYYYYGKHAEKVLHNQLKKDVYLKYDFQQEHLHKNIEQIKLKLELIAEDKEFNSYINNNDNQTAFNRSQKLFYNVLKSNLLGYQLRYINEHGDERIRTEKSDADVSISTELQNKKDRYYFTQTMQKPKGDFYISNIDLNKEYGKVQVPYVPTLRIAMPLFSQEQRKGVLVFNITNFDLLQPELFEEFLDFYILDHNGYFIYHPDPQKRWAGVLGKEYKFSNVFENIATIKELANVKNVYLKEFTHFNQPVYFVGKIKDSILELESKELKKDIFYITLTIFIVSLLMASIISILLSRLYDRIHQDNQALLEALDIVDEYIIYSETDLHGVITHASDAFSKISGYSKEDLIGKPHNIIRHPNNPSSLFKSMWKTIKQGKVWQGEIENITSDGQSYFVYSTIKPKYDSIGKHIGYISIRIDTTKNKELKDQKEQMVFQSRHAIMGEMISIIAHQWKQPLNHLSMELYNMHKQLSSEMVDRKKVKDHYNNSERILLRLSDIITTFKRFFEPNKQIQKVSIYKVYKSTLLIIEPLLNRHKITINFEQNAHTDTVNAIENELIQSFVNIIKNAIDALVEQDISNPKIDIEMHSTDSMVYISICDNAGGVAQEIFEKLSDPYFSTKGNQGTGMGLHMVKMIIEDKLHGDLSFKNNDEGLCVMMSIPLISE